MTCKMCPRTTKMTREITFLEPEFYENIIKQIKPHSKELWKKWEEFCTKTYGIKPDDNPSENHFFLYVIPKVIQLHGYGDPLLDKNLGNVIKILAEHGFESYFSCNPANIDIPKTIEMMEHGLNYLKYSFESTDDEKFKDLNKNPINDVWERCQGFWTYLHIKDAATACRMAVENPNWQGHEKFFLNAKDTMITVETMQAIKSVYPNVEVRNKIDGFNSPILIDLAKDKFGWEPKYSWRDEKFS